MTKTIEVHDNGATLLVTMADEFGTRLMLSTPSGRLCGYAEARRLSLDEAVQRVKEFVADRISRTYRDATVVGLDALDHLDPESLVNGRK